MTEFVGKDVSMDSGRGYRGWVAASTVALLLTLMFLAVERKVRIPSKSHGDALLSAHEVVPARAERGILLSVDPGLAQTQHFPTSDALTMNRAAWDDQRTNELLRQPPEPAANVVLQAPIVSLEDGRLPLTSSSSSIHYLMETMDRAFDSPIQTASTRLAEANRQAKGKKNRVSTSGGSNTSGSRANPQGPGEETRFDTQNSRVAPQTRMMVSITKPQLLADQLSQILGSLSASSPSSLVTSPAPRSPVVFGNGQPPESTEPTRDWALQTQASLNSLAATDGLDNPAAAADLRKLSLLSQQASRLGDALQDHELASMIQRAGYTLQRHVLVWLAIASCLDGTTVPIADAASPEFAIPEWEGLRDRIKRSLASTGDSANWNRYILLDELDAELDTDEVGADEVDFDRVRELAARSLSRLYWPRMTDAQQHFLSRPEFVELASRLSVWGREPIDYRQLLIQLEQFENQPTSRSALAIADAVQSLRHSDQPAQQELASILNTHYRNANLRLCLSGELLQRFLPNGDHEIRPVRQRILGADTSGDSAIRTELKVKLIPDDSAWHIDLGVLGNMVSTTKSSKGPAVFHNTSTATIQSHRTVRVDPMGYGVSSKLTDVDSQDYLRKMSTDFDGLPVLGDFVRLIVREQFEQKRTLAQRITRRIIAREADAELDRRLEQGLKDAERELSSRLIGPLEKFNLNPMVVAMSTTAERMAIRYRVASEGQMAAFTSRPRAPADALLSLQIHQSLLNNTIDQLGLGGKRWTLPELYARIGEVFQQSNWTLPEDVPNDITIRFDDHHPATVELVDGRLRLSLRILELSQPNRLQIERFIVSQNYIPAAVGLDAELIRDGTVEIQSRHDRLRLRVIFASIFVANERIPLVADAWANDSRAAGLAVSQAEIRDGWLSVAISDADSDHAAEMTARSQSLQLN